MTVINRVPDLLAEKFGGADKVIMQRVAQDTRLTYSTVLRWAKRDIGKVDTPTLSTWCKYFGVGVGDILVYVPDEGVAMGRGLSELQKTILVFALYERRQHPITLDYRLMFADSVIKTHSAHALAGLVAGVSIWAAEGSYNASLRAGDTYAQATDAQAELEARGLEVGRLWANAMSDGKATFRASDVQRAAILREAYAPALRRVGADNVPVQWWLKRGNKDLEHWRYADRKAYQAAHAALAKALARLQERGLLVAGVDDRSLFLTEQGIQEAEHTANGNGELMAKLCTNGENLAVRRAATMGLVRRAFGLADE